MEFSIAVFSAIARPAKYPVAGSGVLMSTDFRCQGHLIKEERSVLLFFFSSERYCVLSSPEPPTLCCVVHPCVNSYAASEECSVRYC